jgi:predicted flap endonuclease-1-like 5' DNA nuclease
MDTYTFGMATGEIVSLLLLTFLMGMLLCWLLRQLGLCYRTRKATTALPSGKYHMRDFDINTTNATAPPRLAVQDVYVPKVKVQPRIIDLPDMPNVVLDIPETDIIALDTELPEAELYIPEPDVTLPSIASNRIELPEIDPLLAAIDPHKPIIDPPDMPEDTHTTSNLLNSWLHKAKESVEHLTEKAAPATTDWLHKAKESVEHLTEKATPATSEWLHKAKEIGNDLSAKSSAFASAETLAKGGSTIAAFAASAKELTGKITSNLSAKQDDLQKLVGIGPTFASVLHRAGIHTYAQLSETSPQKLHALLVVEDEQFGKHDTSSWPRQAAIAAFGEWEQLKAYQDTLAR